MIEVNISKEEIENRVDTAIAITTPSNDDTFLMVVSSVLRKYSLTSMLSKIATILSSPSAIGNTAPNTGAFTTLNVNQLSTTVQTLAYAATVTPDWNLGQVATLTLAGNVILENPTNLIAGTSMQIRITQDSVGGRAISYGNKYRFSGGSALNGVLSTIASRVDILTMVCHSTDYIECSLIKDMRV